MKLKNLIATIALAPICLLAAGTETWKATGLTENNRMLVKRALENAHDVGQVTIDSKSGIVILEPKLGRSIDDEDVKKAVANISGVSLSKQKD